MKDLFWKHINNYIKKHSRNIRRRKVAPQKFKWIKQGRKETKAWEWTVLARGVEREEDKL